MTEICTLLLKTTAKLSFAMRILSVVYKTFLFFSLFRFVVQRYNFTVVIKAAKHITVV